jgi:beta-lactam-binding protein with PASTA domain
VSTAADATRVCPRCLFTRPVSEDFCGNCGQFLAWTSERDPQTPQVDPAGLGGEHGPVQTARDRAAVAISVAVDGAPVRRDGALVTKVHPGSAVGLTVTLQNVGTQVRTFTVSVRSSGRALPLPAEWVTIADPDVELNPFHHPDPSTGTTAIALSVPIDNHWRAGEYGFLVTVTTPYEGEVEAVEGTLVVERRFNAVATAAPLIATGRRRARFRVGVLNNGNFPFIPAVRLTDAEERLRFEPDPLAGIPAGALPPAPIEPRGDATFQRVAIAKRHWIGPPIHHQITINVTVPDQEPLPPLLVTFRQRALIPAWLIPLLLMLLALLLALYFLWPRKVDMPDVRGLTTYAAEKQMIHVGLTGKPQIVKRVVPKVKAGTVVDQVPAGPARVPAGQKVILTIALPPAFTLIPDLRGYRWERAEALLSHAHLKLGDVLPSKLETALVIRQSPRAGRARVRGTVVDVVLAGRPLRKVPSVRCLTPKKAQAKLEKRGFRLSPVPEFVKPDTKARSQIPAANTRQRTGREVQLFFKGGKPCPKKDDGGSNAGGGTTGASGIIDVDGKVAFDDGRAIHLAGRSGSVGDGRLAAWSPDGELLALRSGSKIVIRRVSGSSDSEQVASVELPGAVPTAPAFAPGNRDRPVLAFLARRRGETSSFCLVTVSAGELTPSCADLPRVRGRALAWAPDAATILVAGSRRAHPERSGLVRLTAVTPAAADSSLWSVDRELLRPWVRDSRASIFDVAFDPTGTSIALVTDVDASGESASPQIVLANVGPELSMRGARWLGTRACEVAWSSDGAHIAAIQSGDEDGCGGAAGLGPLVAFDVAQPAELTEVTQRASRPAWRPGVAAAAGKGHP